MVEEDASQPMYVKDEKALCFHHELLYEAKVLESKPVDPADKKSAYQYKVHYKGWKATWDDWVPQDRLRKLTDENRELAANLKKEMEALRRGATQKPTPTAARKKAGDFSSTRGSEGRETPVTATGSRGQKRGRDFEVEREDRYRERLAVRIHMPDRLKSLLVDDWENITKNLSLVSLPVKMPVSVILQSYWDKEREERVEGTPEWDILQEVIAGLEEYFNKSLGRILLYRFERDQYLEIYRKTESPVDDLAGKSMAEIYGGEHLLRLMVSLPELIAQTNMDYQSVQRLREELSKITMWLARDSVCVQVFNSEYEPADMEYVDRAKGGEQR
ncbi:MRG-domain-containing protein [Saccharata proteae CBS 121410]|uniref:Chromatin modification-related protein EAF3 n=1 Tax=Saccharata proteae CBS 121410 TaxID=1314787 RepID=A0A9P4LYI2_9PEZI|nr:MRG-domain-containing protein [Saccharata proteae CBS 121410]